IQPGAHVRLDSGPRRVEPAVGALGANLDLAHGSQVLLQPATVVMAELIAERAGFIESGIEDAGAALQATLSPGRSPLALFKKPAEDAARVPLGGQADTIRTARQRMALVAELQGGEARPRRGHLGHELIDGDGVPFRRADLAAREPDGAAIV